MLAQVQNLVCLENFFQFIATLYPVFLFYGLVVEQKVYLNSTVNQTKRVLRFEDDFNLRW